MKRLRMRALATGLILIALGGCQALQRSIDNAQLERGPRFDEDGKFTDEPEVKVPLWSSQKRPATPRDVVPDER